MSGLYNVRMWKHEQKSYMQLMLFDEFWLKSQAFIILLFIISIVNYWSATVKIKHFDVQDILKVCRS